VTSTDGRLGRYVIHLPVTASDLAGACRLARGLGRSLSFLPEIDTAGAEVSEEDNQAVRHQVFCDRRIDRAPARCGLAAEHSGECR
jgi:hypothetical protein